MKFLLIFLCCVLGYNVGALNLPGPLVYVVTPSPRPPQANEPRSRSAPFYYNNWMRRMDSTQNITTTTTPKPKTPDLIFAEFESENGGDMKKSIRKLLEKERIETKTSITTTTKPVYVSDDETNNYPSKMSHGFEPAFETVKVNKEIEKNQQPDMTDYFALYNNLYGDQNQAPVYLPMTTPSTTTITSTTTVPPITATPESMKVENIWHIIDNEKSNQFAGNWEEIPVYNEDLNKDKDSNANVKIPESSYNPETDENFALPGFSTNPGNGAENESRAIRNDQNIQFPYVNLKPFLMKNSKMPSMNSLKTSKKGNNMLTSLDNFYDIKNPVRGEAQEVTHMISQPIDRYNPAQPYLPSPEYGSKSKQSVQSSPPVKAVANLVPPPPPIPKVTADDFPAPTKYESFPPYALPNQFYSPPQSNAPPVTMYQPPQISPNTPDLSDLGPPKSDDGDDGPPADVGYRYKPPNPVPKPPSFLPTIPPPPPSMMKPYKGYSYDKPVMMAPSPPPTMDDKPDFDGYHYSKPDNPEPSMNHAPPSNYGHHDHPPSSYHGDSDYPELIFNNPHGGKDTKGSDDDMGMSPPAAPDMKPGMPDMHDMPPADDSGFPHDFPGDFKYHHDFDDHHHYHEHHTTTTTTTTTEMPRVNRYSYYYLGKKLYYLPLYFSVYFIIYVGALIIKAVLRHKISYPNSWRPNDQTSTFFSKRSVDSWNLSSDQLHHITGKVTKAIASAAVKYMDKSKFE